MQQDKAADVKPAKRLPSDECVRRFGPGSMLIDLILSLRSMATLK